MLLIIPKGVIRIPIYKGARAVITTGAKLGTSQKFADSAARKAQDVRKSRESARAANETAQEVRRTVEESGLAGDDGLPPGFPTVRAEEFFHQVDLYWDRPPASEGVVGSRVRIRPDGGSSRIVTRGAESATIKNLPSAPHTFEVLLFDRWGRESLWSDAVTATPMLTAAETIDLSEIAMLGRLRGLLPNVNLATIEDATKLASELVDSGHLAPDSVSTVKLADGAVTGPKIPDGAVTGVKIPDGAITGPKVADRGITQTKIGEGEITTPLLAASSVEAEKIAATAVTTTKLAAGAVVSDKVAANAVTTRELAASSVTADQIAANQVTTPKLAAGSVLSDKIGANQINAREINANAIQTYHILAGAVTADTMASQNAAAFNLWAQNAMIRSAAIQSLTADKITAGQMTAGQITLAGGGQIKAGQVALNDQGVTMPSVAGPNYLSAIKEYAISSPNRLQGAYWTEQSTLRSAVLQAQSNPNKQGLSMLVGLNNLDDFYGFSNASLRCYSYNPADGEFSKVIARSDQFRVENSQYARFDTPEVRIDNQLQVLGPMRAGNPWRNDEVTIAANRVVRYSAFGSDSGRYLIQRVLVQAGNGWRELPVGPPGSGINMYTTNEDPSGFDIYNSSGSSQRFKVIYW